MIPLGNNMENALVRLDAWIRGERRLSIAVWPVKVTFATIQGATIPRHIVLGLCKKVSNRVTAVASRIFDAEAFVLHGQIDPQDTVEIPSRSKSIRMILRC